MIRIILSTVLLTLSLSAFADGICDFPVPAYQINELAFTGISKPVFDGLMDEVETAYAPVFRQNGCRFVLHRSWNNGTVNAQAWQTGIPGINLDCHVEMFGGFARYPGMTKGAMRKVALHEIGHHLGGYPFYPGESLSCEGQADYFAGAVHHSPESDLNLASLLARLSGETKPWRPGPGLPQARVTDCSHPAAQCRLNTLDAGRLNQSRSRCWFRF